MLTPETLQSASDTLRSFALDERLKQRALEVPDLARALRHVAARYIAGDAAADAIALLGANAVRGHLGSVELVGESVRSRSTAERETRRLIDLAAELAAEQRPATICFDLSHVGALISARLGWENASRIAQAAREAGTSVLVSAEGSDRTDLVLDLWERLSLDFPETGITLQARLHRTPDDLARVMRRPGPVRVVKGAFLEPEDVAFPRDSAPMEQAYRTVVAALVRAGHPVRIATHDAALVDGLRAELGEELRSQHVEFEALQGLGTELLDGLTEDGFVTREYVVYGPEWWLYVLNRIAEHPERAILALADLGFARAQRDGGDFTPGAPAAVS